MGSTFMRSLGASVMHHLKGLEALFQTICNTTTFGQIFCGALWEDVLKKTGEMPVGSLVGCFWSCSAPNATGIRGRTRCCNFFTRRPYLSSTINNVKYSYGDKECNIALK